MTPGASVKPPTLASGRSQRVRRRGEGASGRPIVVDLFCGLGGWSEGFLAEGWEVIGFDVERHRYPSRAIPEGHVKAPGADWNRGESFNGTTEKRLRESPLTGGWDEYPGQLVLQDVLTLHGRQFRDAACIVASPPCQEFSYMAMPWRRAKQIAMTLREEPDANGNFADFPPGYAGSRTLPQLTALFDACFRIQREASEAAGHHIPMVVENVKGAQPWVGRANANYGSFYLWGDVRSVGGRIVAAHRVEFGAPVVKAGRAQKSNPDGTQHGTGSWFAVADSKNRGASKNSGGSWFNVAHNTESGLANNPVSVPAGRNDGLKLRDPDGYERVHPQAFGWKSPRTSSHASARKAASAQIAKIPFALSEYIARSFRPEENE